MAEITRNRNGHTRSVNCTHFGILSVIDRPYFKLFLITYKVNSSSRHLTLRNTTRDAFMDKYIRVRESIFLNLFRRLCSNSLITSATTTSRNISPTPWGCKIVCKRVLFFPPPCKQSLKATCRVLVDVQVPVCNNFGFSRPWMTGNSAPPSLKGNISNPMKFINCAMFPENKNEKCCFHFPQSRNSTQK